jgi:hypothetical protein
VPVGKLHACMVSSAPSHCGSVTALQPSEPVPQWHRVGVGGCAWAPPGTTIRVPGLAAGSAMDLRLTRFK